MAHIVRLNQNIELKLPQAVLLDLDNTLYAYETAHRPALEAVEHKICHILSVSPGDFRHAFEAAKQKIKTNTLHTAASHNRLLYFQSTIEILGFRSKLLLSLDLEQTYWHVFFNYMKPYAYVVEFLDSLRRRGISICIITDLTAQIQMRKIINLNLEEKIDYLVTSEECGGEKITKKPFEIAIQKLNLEDGTSWMIGDSEEADIEPLANARNILRFRFCDAKLTSTHTSADVVFSHYQELHKILEEL